MPTEVYQPGIIETSGKSMPLVFFKKKFELSKPLQQGAEMGLCDGTTTLHYLGSDSDRVCLYVFARTMEEASKGMDRKRSLLIKEGYIKP